MRELSRGVVINNRYPLEAYLGRSPSDGGVGVGFDGAGATPGKLGYGRWVPRVAGKFSMVGDIAGAVEAGQEAARSGSDPVTAAMGNYQKGLALEVAVDLAKQTGRLLRSNGVKIVRLAGFGLGAAVAGAQVTLTALSLYSLVGVAHAPEPERIDPNGAKILDSVDRALRSHGIVGGIGEYKRTRGRSDTGVAVPEPSSRSGRTRTPEPRVTEPPRKSYEAVIRPGTK